jgi:HEAT repeat protein
VRAQAILALGRIGSDAAVDFLASVLRAYKSPSVRSAAANGLGMSGNLRAVPVLAEALEADSDPSVRRRAHAEIMALEKLHGVKLADIKNPPAIPPVQKPVRNRRAEDLFEKRARSRER